jgi:hypothetical protein
MFVAPETSCSKDLKMRRGRCNSRITTLTPHTHEPPLFLLERLILVKGLEVRKDRDRGYSRITTPPVSEGVACF